MDSHSKNYKLKTHLFARHLPLRHSVTITFCMGIFLSALVDSLVYGSHARSPSLLKVLIRVGVVPMKQFPQWAHEGIGRALSFIVTLLQHNKTRKNVNKNFWIKATEKKPQKTNPSMLKSNSNILQVLCCRNSITHSDITHLPLVKQRNQRNFNTTDILFEYLLCPRQVLGISYKNHIVILLYIQGNKGTENMCSATSQYSMVIGRLLLI